MKVPDEHGPDEKIVQEVREGHKGFGWHNWRGRLKIIARMLHPGSEWLFVTIRKKSDKQVEMEVLSNIKASMRAMYVLGCTPERMFGVKPEDLEEFRGFVRKHLMKQQWEKLQEMGGGEE